MPVCISTQRRIVTVCISTQRRIVPVCISTQRRIVTVCISTQRRIVTVCIRTQRRIVPADLKEGAFMGMQNQKAGFGMFLKVLKPTEQLGSTGGNFMQFDI